MKIDTLFVLSAGEGQRMGKIGKFLPKPLWPIFDKTLLELQFDFYRWLNVERQIVNIHHLPSMVRNFIKDRSLDVEVLYEEQLLDVGGAVMNLKKEYVEAKGVLISNVDQLLFMPRTQIEEEMKSLSSFDVILFAIPVKRENGYNKLQVSGNGVFLGVDKAPKEKAYLTYSGVALVNGGRVDGGHVRANFFQSIADPKKRKVKVVDVGRCPYYDFGTRELYAQQVKDLLYPREQGEQGELMKFLLTLGTVQENPTDHKNEHEFGQLKIALESGRIQLKFNEIID